MAETAEEAAREAGAEVRLRKVRETAPDAVVKSQEAWNEQVERTADIEEATPDDLVWADAYLSARRLAMVEDVKKLIRYQTRRLLETAAKLKSS